MDPYSRQYKITVYFYIFLFALGSDLMDDAQTQIVGSCYEHFGGLTDS